MNRLLIILITLAATANAYAGSAITAVSDGDWATASIWNLNRVPQSGDTIIIPTNRTVQLTTTVNLNGVFIKVLGTLNMSNGANLNLDNASLIKVQPSGIINGQGNNDQIKIGNTHVFKGGSTPVTGPVYADNTTGGGFVAYSILPVTFVNFYVAKDNGKINIYWATASENNNDHFELERSANGTTWNVIAVVLSAGNSNTITNYSYTDNKINSSAIYYRIKQVDKDGKAVYTAIKSVNISNETATAKIFTTSANDIAITFDAVQKNVLVKVWNMQGQSLKQQAYNNSAYLSLKLDRPEPGVYVIQITYENDRKESKKILIN